MKEQKHKKTSTFLFHFCFLPKKNVETRAKFLSSKFLSRNFTELGPWTPELSTWLSVQSAPLPSRSQDDDLGLASFYKVRLPYAVGRLKASSLRSTSSFLLVSSTSSLRTTQRGCRISKFAASNTDGNSFAALLSLWTTVLLLQQCTVGIDTLLSCSPFLYRLRAHQKSCDLHFKWNCFLPG